MPRRGPCSANSRERCLSVSPGSALQQIGSSGGCSPRPRLMLQRIHPQTTLALLKKFVHLAVRATQTLAALCLEASTFPKGIARPHQLQRLSW